MGAILDRSYCEGSAARLKLGLEWKQTPEGYAFWRAIYMRLNEYGNGSESSFAVWQAHDCGLISAAMQGASLGKELPIVANLRAEIEKMKGDADRQAAEISALIAERDDLRRKLRRADFAGWRG